MEALNLGPPDSNASDLNHSAMLPLVKLSKGCVTSAWLDPLLTVTAIWDQRLAVSSLDTLSWRQTGLRQGTVPTIIGAHTFCAHGRHGLHQARAIVDLDVINYATKYTTEIVESIIFLL